MVDQSTQTLTENIERELLNEIVANLDNATITVEEAQAIAKEFLELLPLQDKKDLHDKLHKLSKDHRATADLYIKFAKPIEEDERQRKLTLMSEYIKKGHIEHALAVAKGGIQHA